MVCVVEDRALTSQATIRVITINYKKWRFKVFPYRCRVRVWMVEDRAVTQQSWYYRIQESGVMYAKGALEREYSAERILSLLRNSDSRVGVADSSI